MCHYFFEGSHLLLVLNLLQVLCTLDAKTYGAPQRPGASNGDDWGLFGFTPRRCHVAIRLEGELRKESKHRF